MTKLPKRPEQHVIGNRALTVVKLCLPSEWIVREEPEQSDYGIDLEIELASREVSGRLFKAQVRGHSGIKWRSDGSFSQSVSETTLNYWRALPLPVVLFVPDVSLEAVYWAPGKTSTGSHAVVVRKDSELPKTAQHLERYVVNWLDQRGARALKYGLPLFSQMWERLQEHIEGDFFVPIDGDLYALIEHVYRQTQLTRDVFGLPSTMFPWELWPARARTTYGSDADMYCGTFDEIVAYLKPLIDELTEVGREEILHEDPSPHNAAAQYWATDYGFRFVFTTEFDKAPDDFWKGIDKHLEELGVLRARAIKKPPKTEPSS
jgi:hypothetical protein